MARIAKRSERLMDYMLRQGDLFDGCLDRHQAFNTRSGGDYVVGRAINQDRDVLLFYPDPHTDDTENYRPDSSIPLIINFVGFGVSVEDFERGEIDRLFSRNDKQFGDVICFECNVPTYFGDQMPFAVQSDIPSITEKYKKMIHMIQGLMRGRKTVIIKGDSLGGVKAASFLRLVLQLYPEFAKKIQYLAVSSPNAVSAKYNKSILLTIALDIAVSFKISNTMRITDIFRSIFLENPVAFYDLKSMTYVYNENDSHVYVTRSVSDLQDLNQELLMNYKDKYEEATTVMKEIKKIMQDASERMATENETNLSLKYISTSPANNALSDDQIQKLNNLRLVQEIYKKYPDINYHSLLGLQKLLNKVTEPMERYRLQFKIINCHEKYFNPDMHSVKDDACFMSDYLGNAIQPYEEKKSCLDWLFSACKKTANVVDSIEETKTMKKEKPTGLSDVNTCHKV